MNLKTLAGGGHHSQSLGFRPAAGDSRCVVAMAYGGAQMQTPYHVGETLPLSLDPLNLP